MNNQQRLSNMYKAYDRVKASRELLEEVYTDTPVVTELLVIMDTLNNIMDQIDALESEITFSLSLTQAENMIGDVIKQDLVLHEFDECDCDQFGTGFKCEPGRYIDGDMDTLDIINYAKDLRGF